MPNIYSECIHPEDQAALQNLEALPLFPQLAKGFMRVFSEQMLHGMNMAQKIRLGQQQLPKLYALLPPICNKLGIPEPELYLQQDPNPNAYTFGDTRTFITVTSGLIQCLGEDELRAVIAHECGHIVCRHVLYNTMASMLMTYGLEIVPLPGIAVQGLQLALFQWSRRSELSADRVAAVVMGRAKPVVDTMIRLAGGPKEITDEVNVEAYVQQAQAYAELKTGEWNNLLQMWAIKDQSHPFPSVRAREIQIWCETPEFARIKEGISQKPGRTCSGCGGMLQAGWRFCRHCGKQL